MPTQWLTTCLTSSLQKATGNRLTGSEESCIVHWSSAPRNSQVAIGVFQTLFLKKRSGQFHGGWCATLWCLPEKILGTATLI